MLPVPRILRSVKKSGKFKALWNMVARIPDRLPYSPDRWKDQPLAPVHTARKIQRLVQLRLIKPDRNQFVYVNAQRLMALRTKTGISRRKLAQLLQLDIAILRKIENGSHWPTRTLVRRIASELQIHKCQILHLSIQRRLRLLGKRTTSAKDTRP